MTNIKVKIATGAITLAFLASTFAPAAFGATIKIKGNGTGSNNTVHANNNSHSSVKQTNKTAVVNLVGVFQNTGGNSANQNTGGDVTVNSGNATAHVTNTTTTGGNIAALPCGQCSNPVDENVTISGNGAGSHNSVNANNNSSSCITQTNHTLVVNGVLVGQNTGNNEANQNTGGTVGVDSGNASATVTNTTTTGNNVLVPPTL